MANLFQRPGREMIMSTLFATLSASIETQFTADIANGSNVLSNPSTLDKLFLGLPVIAPGIPANTVIASLSPLTMSQHATVDAPASSIETGFLTKLRRFRHWSQVPSQPAIILRDAAEEPSYNQTSLQELCIYAQLWLYSNSGKNPDAVPAIALNYLLDAIQKVMSPDQPQTNRFTLGGLVHWCRIVGRIDKESGDASGQAMAVMDVEIIVP